MQTNKLGVDLIKSFESLRLESYVCPAGKLTIGYGHTGPDVQPGMVITEDQAEDLLRKDLAHSEKGVEAILLVPVTSNQFSALVSLAFNIGLVNFSKSTLLKLLDDGDTAAAAEQFLKWNKARVKGDLVPLAGLTRRREAERALFLTPDEEA